MENDNALVKLAFSFKKLSLDHRFDVFSNQEKRKYFAISPYRRTIVRDSLDAGTDINFIKDYINECYLHRGEKIPTPEARANNGVNTVKCDIIFQCKIVIEQNLD